MCSGVPADKRRKKPPRALGKALGLNLDGFAVVHKNRVLLLSDSFANLCRQRLDAEKDE